MTKVIIVRNKNRIVSVECSGHTGYAEQGEDIVCAALSSVVQTAVLGVMVVAGVNADYVVNEDDGFLSLKLPKDISQQQSHDSSVILDTMYLGINDLYEGYSDFIELEVKNVY